MIREVSLTIDVSHALGLGEPAHIAVRVVLPDPALLGARPTVCFAKPGGGYTGGYFTCDLPGPATGNQAAFHAARGWIVVASDNLGSGNSSNHAPHLLGFTQATAAARAAEEEVLLRLANGVLAEGYPPVTQPLRLGIGQSTGGALTLVQQARFESFDGIALLGFSALHNHPPTPPGERPVVTPWFARDLPADAPGGVINAGALRTEGGTGGSPWASLAWSFHYDDVPADVIEQDLAHYEAIAAGQPDAPRDPAPWLSYTTPHEAARFTLTPGTVAPEAAAVRVPVLCAMGERDLVVDPPGESRAFRSSPSVDLFVCPRMGHMHNFAGTRSLFWERIHRFGEWCGAAQGSG
ncbi:MAG: hypothetical protein KGL44_02940 [Sphingomonadales bacterium]|nr:hypothetical protein [Sphingomonadales bacterium]